MSTLRELVAQAASDLSMYKHPNIDEAKNRLNKIIEAAGLGSIAHDTVESIDFYGENVRIETSWSVRGCENTSDYVFPVNLLDAADPIKAATVWGLNEKIANEERELGYARLRVKDHEAKLAHFKVELAKAVEA